MQTGEYIVHCFQCHCGHTWNLYKKQFSPYYSTCPNCKENVLSSPRIRR